MFMGGKLQYCLGVSVFQLNLQIQCHHSKNPSKLFYGYQQINSNIYMKSHSTQNSQHNIKGKEQSQRTEATWFQDLL